MKNVLHLPELSIVFFCPMLELYIVDTINRGLDRRFVLVGFSDGAYLHLCLN